MKTFEKMLSVLAKNLGYTIVLIIAAILFLYFSDGLIEGIIAAVSALIAYACIVQLAREYRKGGKNVVEKPVSKAPAKSVKKSAPKKSSKK